MNKWLCLPLAALSLYSTAGAQTAITSPTEHFGFELGADGMYASWDQIVAYYQTLGRESDRVQTEPSGRPRWGIRFSR